MHRGPLLYQKVKGDRQLTTPPPGHPGFTASDNNKKVLNNSLVHSELIFHPDILIHFFFVQSGVCYSLQTLTLQRYNSLKSNCYVWCSILNKFMCFREAPRIKVCCRKFQANSLFESQIYGVGGWVHKFGPFVPNKRFFSGGFLYSRPRSTFSNHRRV